MDNVLFQVSLEEDGKYQTTVSCKDSDDLLQVANGVVHALKGIPEFAFFVHQILQEEDESSSDEGETEESREEINSIPIIINSKPKNRN